MSVPLWTVKHAAIQILKNPANAIGLFCPGFGLVLGVYSELALARCCIINVWCLSCEQPAMIFVVRKQTAVSCSIQCCTFKGLRCLTLQTLLQSVFPAWHRWRWDSGPPAGLRARAGGGEVAHLSVHLCAAGRCCLHNDARVFLLTYSIFSPTPLIKCSSGRFMKY